jgi:hypothetical protein
VMVAKSEEYLKFMWYVLCGLMQAVVVVVFVIGPIVAFATLLINLFPENGVLNLIITMVYTIFWVTTVGYVVLVRK